MLQMSLVINQICSDLDSNDALEIKTPLSWGNTLGSPGRTEQLIPASSVPIVAEVQRPVFTVGSQDNF